jgi:hypothetical protein
MKTAPMNTSLSRRRRSSSAFASSIIISYSILLAASNGPVTVLAQFPQQEQLQQVQPSSPAYTDVQDAYASLNQGDVLSLSAQTSGEIPRLADEFVNSVLAFGYGWLNSQTLEGLVATIHPAFKDSSQDPNAWHTHLVRLSPSGCVEELGASQDGIQIDQNRIALTVPGALAQDTTMANFKPDTAASFLVVPSLNFMTCHSGISVILLDATQIR